MDGRIRLGARRLARGRDRPQWAAVLEAGRGAVLPAARVRAVGGRTRAARAELLAPGVRKSLDTQGGSRASGWDREVEGQASR